MALAKTAIVASSILCTACVAAAVALPTSGALTKTVDGQAKLAATYIDFAHQSAFDAQGYYATLNDPNAAPEDIAAAYANLSLISGVPFINLIQAGVRSGFYGLASTSALSAFDIYQNGNGLDPEDEGYIPPGSFNAFVPTDSNPGYAALSGVSSLQAYQYSGDPAALQGIDAFSAIPAYQRLAATPSDRTALYGLASTSATESFDHFQTGYADANPDNLSYGPGSFQAFAVTPANPITGLGGQQGYAALSGVQAIQNYLNSNGDLSQLNTIDAFSAIQTVPVPDTTTPPPANNDVVVQPQLKLSRFAASAPAASSPAVVEDTTPAVVQDAAPVVVTPAAVVAPPAAPPVANNKQGEVRNSANYSPAGLPVLFGSGKGKGADNGISGWGSVANGLRGALGMGPDPSTKSDGGDAGGGDGGAK